MDESSQSDAESDNRMFVENAPGQELPRPRPEPDRPEVPPAQREAQNQPENRPAARVVPWERNKIVV